MNQLDEVDLRSDSVEWLGASPVDADDGVRLTRLRTDTGRSVRKAVIDESGLAAGARLRLRLRGSSPSASISLTLSTLPGRDDDRAVTVDAVIDGEIAVSASPVDSSRDPLVFRFDVPTTGDVVTVDMWLPYAIPVLIRRLEVSQPLVARADSAGSVGGSTTARMEWLAYGSSITFGRFAAGPARTWTAIVARSLDLELTNLGFAGQALLDEEIAREIAARPADVVSVCAGINVHNRGVMSETGYASALRTFLSTIREGHPETPVIVVSPISSSVRESTRAGGSWMPSLVRRAVGTRIPEWTPSAVFGPTLAELRSATHRCAGSLADAGDRNLHVIDGLDVFGPADEHLLVDGLHPGADGARLIADRFGPIVRSIVDGGRAAEEGCG